MSRNFIAGTRGSALALWQTRHVAQRLAAGGVSIAERVITTRGDVDLSERLAGKLEKGFFTEELEAALRNGEIDWAVHSLKDLPTRPAKDLVIGAVLERASASDWLLVRAECIDEKNALPLKAKAKVGSSSLRREAMLKHYAPECVAAPLRGNVPTRVEKLLSGQYDAVILAAAGVSRLKIDLNEPSRASSRTESRVGSDRPSVPVTPSGVAGPGAEGERASTPFTPSGVEGRGIDGRAAAVLAFELNPRRWPCAPGQGAIAVQCRESDAEVRALLTSIHHEPTARATGIEREFLRLLEGGCTTPFGCYVEGSDAWLGFLEASRWHQRAISVPATPEARWYDAELKELSTSTKEQFDEHPWLTRRV